MSIPLAVVRVIAAHSHGQSVCSSGDGRLPSWGRYIVGGESGRQCSVGYQFDRTETTQTTQQQQQQAPTTTEFVAEGHFTLAHVHESTDCAESIHVQPCTRRGHAQFQ